MCAPRLCELFGLEIQGARRLGQKAYYVPAPRLARSSLYPLSNPCTPTPWLSPWRKCDPHLHQKHFPQLPPSCRRSEQLPRIRLQQFSSFVSLIKFSCFQLFISLLSETTIKSKYCQDELALAYVSNKPIFPVGLKQPQDLFPQMDTGM